MFFKIFLCGLILDIAISCPQICSTSPPNTWSVDEVVKYIEGSDLAEFTELFKKHVSGNNHRFPPDELSGTTTHTSRQDLSGRLKTNMLLIFTRRDRTEGLVQW